MRILVAHNVPCRHPGGMNRIMEFLHRPLRAAGHQVDFLCSEDVPAAARGRWGRFLYPWQVRRRAVRASAAGTPYDIVNVHEPSSALIAALRPGLGGAAVVVTTHGVERRAWDLALEELRLGRSGPSWGSRLWYPPSSLWQSRVGLTHADAVFCLSLEDRDYLARVMGVDPARIVRIVPGADPVFAAAARERDYASATRLVFAGTWRKNKGIEDLAPAFTEIARRHEPLRLTVLGAGVAEATVRSAFPPDLQPRVATVATRTDEETARVLAAHDIFLLPSLFEGTPLTLMEAMASGLPIVTTDTCGMRDVIRHEETGLLVPIRSPDAIVAALARLLTDSALRQRLGQAARVEAESRYTWDRVAASVRTTYQRLVGDRADRGRA